MPDELHDDMENLHLILLELCSLTSLKGGAVLFTKAVLTGESLHERALALMWLLHTVENVSDSRERRVVSFHGKIQAAIYLTDADEVFKPCWQ
jgi:hypothetical protein